MKKIEYNSRQVRLFLGLLLVFCALLTLKFVPKSDSTRRLAWLTAEGAVVLFFLFVPRLFFPLFRLIMIGSGYIGNTVFAILSILVFYIVLTPMSLASRLFGKRYMKVPIEPAETSYFEEPEAPGHYENQY